MDTPLFYIALFIHLSGLILGFGSALVTDLYGLLWIRDRARFPQVVEVSGVTGNFVWAGWGILVMAGLPLLFLKGAVDNLFIVKLFFVALVGLNGILLHRLQKRVRVYHDGDDVPATLLFRLAFALFISQVGWWGAILIGFLHRHVQTTIDWPALPWLLISLVAAALVAIWATGESWIKKNRAKAEDMKEKVTP